MKWTQWLRLPYRAEVPKESHEEKVQRLAREADDALSFLTNPGAIAAYQRLLQTYADTILDSKPGDADLREMAYTKAHILQELVRDMAGAVQAWELQKKRLDRE